MTSKPHIPYPRSHILKRKSAFSLMEVLIAMTILAVGMTAAIVLFPAGLKNYRMSRSLTEMGLFAKNKLNEVKAIGNYTDDSGTVGYMNWTMSFSDVALEGEVNVTEEVIETNEEIVIARDTYSLISSN